MEKEHVDIVKLNATYGRIITEDIGVMEYLYKKFAVPVENYWFMPKYKAGIWDGKVHFVERNGKFYNGLLDKVVGHIDPELYNVDVDPEFNKIFDKNNIKEDFLSVIEETIECEFAPYFYQLRGALKALYHQRAIVEHCTSSGKSYTLSLIISYLLKKFPEFKILVVVPKIDLVEQLTEEFTNTYGLPEDLIGKYCGYEKNDECPITVSTWQSIYKKKDFLMSIDALLVDECHGLRANEVRKVAEYSTKADFRIGVTGTLPESKSDKLLVECVMGPIVDQVKTEDLIKLKKVSDIDISIISLLYNESIVSQLESLDYQTEKEFVENCDFRNNLIVKAAKKIVDKDKNVLILVQKIEHGKTLVEKLEEQGVNVSMVCGDIKIEERNKIRHETEESGGRVIVATVGVYSTGVSIKRLHAVMFASPGKAKIQTLQSIGRGLRLHSTKSKVLVFDFTENLKFSKKHSKKRTKYYKENNFNYKIKEVDIDA